jgi:GNAT superfamily N-acetyltransferase
MLDADLCSVREASVADVALMEQARSLHGVGQADERMADYFRGLHHPHKALLPRIGYLALADGKPVAYTAGHLTTRFGYEGELQYLFVAPPYRRRGIGRRLVSSLANWFVTHGALRVCVCVDLESEPAAPFYTSLGASPFRPSWYGWENIAAAFTAKATS